MTKKRFREMTRFEKMYHSLGMRMFRIVLVFVILIAVLALAISFLLYSASVRREHKSIATNLARTTAAFIDKDKSWDYAYMILKVYDDMPEDVKANPYSEEYQAYFKDVQDSGFKKIRASLHNIQVENNAKSVYLAAVDVENAKLVYLVDSDYSDQFCPPGSWDSLTEKEVQIYLGIMEEGGLDAYVSEGRTFPAYISNTEEYGYLCTAADELLAGVRGYKILAFVDIDMQNVTFLSRQFLWQSAVLLLVVAAVICWLMTVYLKRKLINPINMLAVAAEKYSNDKRYQIDSSDHFKKLDIRTGDELENLCVTMQDMEKEITDYEQHLTTVTAEKERISAELDVAKQIQASMIPHIYPAFPERSEFEVYATMTPAKEIGGDFYDFFLIDEDHLAVVMADVSGKGIPAALFMMASKILIENSTLKENRSPAKILEIVNNEICKNNEAEMFVTVWLGILELSSGHMVCANAGHEFPTIKRKGGSYELFKDPHGFVIGGMDGIKYKDYEIDLQPGDAVFVYTDGVAEATDAEKQLFGTERMVEALNIDPNAPAEKVLKNVKDQIDLFVQDADQFDDITMMSLIYYGGEGHE